MMGSNAIGRNLALVCFAVLFTGLPTAFAQDSECEQDIDKKALKYFQMGTDRKKYGKTERLEHLREAIKIEEEYLDARYFLAMELIKTAQYKGTSFRGAEKHLKKIAEVCPFYHYQVYYYLGAIALGRKEYGPAVDYYERYFGMAADAEVFTDDDDKVYVESRADYEYAKFFRDAYANPVQFDPKLVANVSTTNDEYLPLISPDNKYMFFTRRSVKQELVRGTSFSSDKVNYIERFSRSDNDNGRFNEGIALPPPFNTREKEQYGGATISLDNKTIIMTVCKPATKSISGAFFMNCDLYQSEYVYGYNEKEGREMWYWTELKNLGPNVNTPEGWEAQPSLSGDGQTLYFATIREGCMKNEKQYSIDIYTSERDANGGWAPAVNMGEGINTIYNEKTPFIHTDSRTLYFSSDGHLGFGGYDVYLARQNDDRTWEKPQNIGYPINTENDEHGFIVSTDGTSVYFGSDQLKKQAAGGLDIFSFELYEEAKPEDVVFLSGTITDESGQPAKNAHIEIKNMKTNEVTKINVDENDGRYAAVARVQEDADLVVNVKGDGSAFNSHLIASKKSREEAAREKLGNSTAIGTKRDTVQQTFFELDTKVEKLAVGKPYRINDIYFRTNSAELSKSSLLVLNEFASYLKDNPSMKVGIYGHTDNVGDATANKALSWERAFSVTGYLQEKGIASSRMKFDGFGEEKPVDTNDSPLGRAKNRRTEFVVLSR